MIKVLNLYAGIGGNRKLWTDVDVTAVEINPKIAEIYQDYFPDDTVIVADAHQFLLEHYKEYDFIWSSPPCPTHSRPRLWASKGGKYKAIYPDMTLYEEIIFLQYYCNTKWVVENVISYYDPLIPAKKIGRHLFWSNFYISSFDAKDANIHKGSINEWQDFHGFNLSKYRNIGRKDKILRNCVYPPTGLHIFESAMKIESKQKEFKQRSLFDLCECG